MIQALRRYLTAPETLTRLQALAAGAPSAAPISLHLPLGKDATDWLELLPPNQPWWYRARPARQEYRLAIGHALHVSTAGPNRFPALDSAFTGLCQHWRRNGPALAFAGFAFDPLNQTPLPNALLAIPAILLECMGGECSVTLSAPAGRLHQALTEWPHWLTASHPTTAPTLRPCRPETLLDQAWMARVNAALRDIHAGHLDKVVLGRNRRIEANGTLSAAPILGRLNMQQPGSLIYGHGTNTAAFVGATPERLVSLDADRVDADALAGTAWPGSLALHDAKNLHEQSLVVRAVCEALSPFCVAPPIAATPRKHVAGQLMHLRSRVTAVTRPETTLFELVRALHPTPAIGGFPPHAAQAWLAAHGEQRAGWYSGGLGILTPDGNGEFSVALRSALISGQTAELQAGAGIVDGSDPQLELAETEAKLGTLLAALSPHSTPDSSTGKRA